MPCFVNLSIYTSIILYFLKLIIQRNYIPRKVNEGTFLEDVCSASQSPDAICPLFLVSEIVTLATL